MRFLATLGSQCCDWKAQAHPKKNIEKSVFHIHLTVAFLVLLKKKLVFSLSFFWKHKLSSMRYPLRSSHNSPTQAHQPIPTPLPRSIPIRTVQEAPWFWAFKRRSWHSWSAWPTNRWQKLPLGMNIIYIYGNLDSYNITSIPHIYIYNTSFAGS